jgi:hypothetical protein
MNIVPSPAEAPPAPEQASDAGRYFTRLRRPRDREDVVDAEVVGAEAEVVDAEVISQDRQPRNLQLYVRLPEDFDLHAAIGTVVATLALGFVLLLVALVGALVAIEMFTMMISEPL